MTILYCGLFLIIGLFLGLAIEVFACSKEMKKLEDENAQLRKELTYKKNTEVIEINDYRDIIPKGIPEEDYFRPW